MQSRVAELCGRFSASPVDVHVGQDGQVFYRRPGGEEEGLNKTASSVLLELQLTKMANVWEGTAIVCGNEYVDIEKLAKSLDLRVPEENRAWLAALREGARRPKVLALQCGASCASHVSLNSAEVPTFWLRLETPGPVALHAELQDSVTGFSAPLLADMGMGP